MTKPVISATGVEAGYAGARVLRGAHLTLRQGEIVGLIGPNGAGKTTLFRVISGLLPLDAGEVEVLGRSVRASSTLDLRVAGVGYVPQEGNIFPNLSVSENLETAYKVAGRLVRHVSLDERLGFVERLFPRLKERRTQHAGLMSGGEQRMVAIGMGLVLKPKVLLLDEPTTGLAPVVVHELMQTIRRLRDDEGISIVLIEQNIASMLKVVDRLFVMKDGACREFEGNPVDLGRQNIWEYL